MTSLLRDDSLRHNPNSEWFRYNKESMDQKTFTIIFQKLAEVREEPSLQAEASRTEIDEIADLRRLVLEVTDPDPLSYTTT